jgi:hypothetical protein
MLVAALLGMQLASRRGAVPCLAAFVGRPKLSLRLLAEIVGGTAATLVAAWLLTVVVPMQDDTWLMFATLHLTPLTIVHHTLLGYVCARARLESRSMLVPVCIHAAYNAVVALTAW